MTEGTPGTESQFADEAQRYRLDSRIATGGMGQVWRATDTRLGRTVAVKLLKTEYADDETFRTRFSSEAHHAAALHHPGVAAVYDFGESGGETARPYLVMELVDGQPLSALIAPGRPIDPEVARDLLAQAADALGAAHAAGIVHRDVKPANLLITPDRRVKITDFGIARATEGMALTLTGQVMGTPQYLSPEQAQGGTAGPASDVYSLGVVAFECLTSRRPFVGDTPVATALAHLREPVPELPDEIPADLARVVRRALSKDPDDRFPDGSAFAAALRDPATVPMAAAGGAAAVPATQVLTSPPAPAASPTPPPTTAAGDDERRRRTIPWLWILLGLAVVAAIIVLVLVADGDQEEPADPDPSRDRPQPSQTAETTAPPEETTSPPEETTSAPPETFDIDEGDYVGRPFPEVEAELRELGLVVQRSDVDNDGSQVPETVAGVEPTSDLTEGDTVTVSVWKPPEGPPDDAGNDNSGPGNSNSGGNGNGNSGEGSDG